MIYWLVQSSDRYLDLKREKILARWLSIGEHQAFAVLKTDKRRQDWLLGRWTAKCLLQTVICQHYGVRLPLDRLSILADSDGAPVVSTETYWPFSLSISHSNGRSFCAVIERGAWPLGVDIERIEPRSEAFVTDYCTTDEVDRINRSPSRIHDGLVTAIWSAKEATLKALKVGLRVDTRAVTCMIVPSIRFPVTWQPFRIVLEVERLTGLILPLTGWWRVERGFVLTLVSRCETF